MGYKRDKKNGYGSPGVCNYKHTLSGKGYPCFSDHENTNCAWCNKEGYQCKQDSHTGPGSKKGSRCQKRTNQKYCESQQGDCKHIAKCDPNATCKKKRILASMRSIGNVNVTRDGVATESNVWTATAHSAQCPGSKLRLLLTWLLDSIMTHMLRT